MAVAEAWASVDGGPIETAVRQEGDLWWFPVPAGMTGTFFAEIWAEDDAGNQSYAVAVLTLEEGVVKCIRWIRDRGYCKMLPVERPMVAMAEARPSVVMDGRVSMSMDMVRPAVTMLPYECFMSGEVC